MLILLPGALDHLASSVKPMHPAHDGQLTAPRAPVPPAEGSDDRGVGRPTRPADSRADG